MALENSNDMVMPVSPMNGGYGNGTFGNDMMSELNSLAMSMPDEQSRQAVQSIMNKYR